MGFVWPRLALQRRRGRSRLREIHEHTTKDPLAEPRRAREGVNLCAFLCEGLSDSRYGLFVGIVFFAATAVYGIWVTFTPEGWAFAH